MEQTRTDAKRPVCIALDEQHKSIMVKAAQEWGVSRSAAARRIFAQFAAGQGRGPNAGRAGT